MVDGPEQARILVVSASPYMRYIVSGQLSSEPDLFVVGTARSPEEIAHKRALLRPDVVVFDLESSGDLAGLQPTLSEGKLPVLVMCSHNDQGAELALAALEAGAADVVAHPQSSFGIASFTPDLLHKARGLAHIRGWGNGAAGKQRSSGLFASASRCPGSTPSSKASPRRFALGEFLVVVSASTGGINPLIQLLTPLPADLRASLLILSSLPESCLRLFLGRVNPSTTLHLRQAHDGSPLQSGVAYFAPFDYHLSVTSRGYLTLDRGRCRDEFFPSADVTMSSLATQYGPAVIGVVLSGIGHDGVQGALNVRAAGGAVIVQEMTTCLADEAPAAVIRAGAATSVLPAEQIADEIVLRTRSDRFSVRCL